MGRGTELRECCYYVVQYAHIRGSGGLASSRTQGSKMADSTAGKHLGTRAAVISLQAYLDYTGLSVCVCSVSSNQSKF